MEHISTLLTTKKAEFDWSNLKIHHMTKINETTISKHLSGTRKVSLNDLKSYCDCFRLNFEDIRIRYLLDEIDICKKGTLKIIIASVAGIGAGALAYAGVKNLIDTNCKQISN